MSGKPSFLLQGQLQIWTIAHPKELGERLPTQIKVYKSMQSFRIEVEVL